MRLAFILGTLISLSACEFSCNGSKAKEPAAIPKFDADFSYAKILEYEKFGPKLPGSEPHRKTGDWIASELKAQGYLVQEQKAVLKNAQNNDIPIRNLIAIRPGHFARRILLTAHWDNRPHADRDPAPSNHLRSVPGVNDGGSGVAVLLTIAQAIHSQKTDSNIAVDLAFWDAEDGGSYSQPKTFCLGSQYWAKNPIPENYSAEFGINFDMVGRKGSVFPIEAYSWSKAPHLITKLFSAAKKSGNQDYFTTDQVGPIVDDHYFISEGRGFPMIDLIYMTSDGKFAPEWHTLSDTSEHISRDVMKAVGQTTLEMIYGKDDH
jgi:hypothetical protein